MRWYKANLRSSMHGLLGRDAPASTGWVRDPALEEVRQAMQDTLAGLEGAEVSRIALKLRYAGDIEALWYLRTELFSILAPLQGERLAHQTIATLTPRFQGLLPRSLLPPR